MTQQTLRGARRWTALSLSAVAALPLLVAAPGTATAAETATCRANGPTYAVNADGDLLSYPLKSPVDGAGGYSPRTTIGGGFQRFGLLLAGPDGSFYGFKDDGVFYYHRTAAGSWDVVGRQISQHLGWLGTPANRGHATIDRAGWLWIVEDGVLRAIKYNPVTNDWDVGNSRPHDEGWGRYNLIVAADAGVLYGRSASDGQLYRSRYDLTSQRWEERHVLVSDSDWNMFKSISSNGGDTLLATHTSTGKAFYYRFDENTRKWPVAPVEVGNGGWTPMRDVAAAPDNCSIVNDHTPAAPSLEPEQPPVTSTTMACAI